MKNLILDIFGACLIIFCIAWITGVRITNTNCDFKLGWKDSVEYESKSNPNIIKSITVYADFFDESKVFKIIEENYDVKTQKSTKQIFYAMTDETNNHKKFNTLLTEYNQHCCD